MTFFLRDKNINFTIVETELFYCDEGHIDLSSAVDIENYSLHLLKLNEFPEKQLEYIDSIAFLYELRCWLFEVYEDNAKENKNDIVSKISEFYREIALKFDFNFVID